MENTEPIPITTRNGKPLSESEKQEMRHAQQMREDIAALRHLPAWGRYYELRSRKDYLDAEERLLHDTTTLDTPEKLWAHRLVFLALEKVATMLETDDATCRRVLGVTE